MGVVGVTLWIVAIVVDAPLVAVIIPILMVMGGGVLMAQSVEHAPSADSPQDR